MMTVRELVAHLETLPQDFRVTGWDGYDDEQIDLETAHVVVEGDLVTIETWKLRCAKCEKRRSPLVHGLCRACRCGDLDPGENQGVTMAKTRVVIGHLTEAKILELELLLSGDAVGRPTVELPARFRDANGEREAVVVFEREPRKDLAFSSPETISEFAQRPDPPEAPQ